MGSKGSGRFLKTSLVGSKFGAWTVIARAPNQVNFNKLSGKVRSKSSKWVCECQCGARAEVYGSHLRNGASQSCGCRAHKEAPCEGCGVARLDGKFCKACHRIKNNLKALGVQLTVQQYRAMMTAANGVCESCELKVSQLFLDHNHITGQVRGMICRACNYSEGYFKDDYTRLLRLYEYCIKNQK